MDKYTVLITLLVGLLTVSCSTHAAPAQPVPAALPKVTAVEIIYLNHGPVRSVLADVDKLLEGYGEQVHVTRYDFNTPEGQAFAQSKDLSGHIPMAIFVNGSIEFTTGDRSVSFLSFPQGQGTGIVPDGAWTIDDLQQVLDQAVEES